MIKIVSTYDGKEKLYLSMLDAVRTEGIFYISTHTLGEPEIEICNSQDDFYTAKLDRKQLTKLIRELVDIKNNMR